jgi:hypothetical protein
MNESNNYLVIYYYTFIIHVLVAIYYTDKKYWKNYTQVSRPDLKYYFIQRKEENSIRIRMIFIEVSMGS